jgi:hypothetical protein
MYRSLIKKFLSGRDHDPRHIEAWMRLEHSTLDGLSFTQFKQDVEIAIDCIKGAGFAASESLAASYEL